MKKEWCELFPNVSFTDKICVEFKNGESIVIKGLYYDESELHEIEWSSVKECFEV